MVRETGSPVSGSLDAVDRQRTDVGAYQQEDQGQRYQQHFKGDFIRGLAPLGPLDQGNHPVQEGLAWIGGDPDDDRICDDRGAAGDRTAISTRLTDHRG